MPTTLDIPLVNNGSAVLINNDGGLGLASGVTLTNASTLLVGFGTTLHGTGSLVNQSGATINAVTTSSQNYVSIGVSLTNAGLFNVTGTPVMIVGGSSSTGQYVSNVTGGLDFQGTQSFTAGSISSAGQVEFDGTATVATSYSVSGTTAIGTGADATFSGSVSINGSQLIDNGTADFTAASLASPLSLDDVYLNGNLLLSGGLTVTGPDTTSYPYPAQYVSGVPTTFGFSWVGGTLSGSGTASIDTSSLLGWLPTTLDIPLVNNGSAVLINNDGGLGLASGVTLTNASTLLVGFGTTLHGTGSLVNQSGATINAVTTSSQNYVSIGVSLTNAGLIEDQGTPITVGGALTNSGTVSLGGNDLTVGTYTQTAGNTLLGGGTLDPDTITLSGGTLSGPGTLAANVNNTGGTIYPGGVGGTGTLTISGTYSQSSGGTLNIDLSGAGSGQYDVLSVSSTASLGGTLTITPLTGFVADPTQSLAVLTAGGSGVSGTFGTVNNPAYAGRALFNVQYTGTAAVALRHGHRRQ